MTLGAATSGSSYGGDLPLSTRRSRRVSHVVVVVVVPCRSSRLLGCAHVAATATADQNDGAPTIVGGRVARLPQCARSGIRPLLAYGVSLGNLALIVTNVVSFGVGIATVVVARCLRPRC